VGLFVATLVTWGSQGFGELDPVVTMRLPIFGMVLVVGGIQVAGVACAVSLIGGARPATGG
jgi:hypothetical protein